MIKKRVQSTSHNTHTFILDAISWDCLDYGINAWQAFM